MNREQRLDAADAAIRALAEHRDPATLGDGLSPAMARACLTTACDLLDRGSLDQASMVPGCPPALAAVVAARGVFAAPLEWVALLAVAGSEVILKAPAAAPAFGQAVAEAFSTQGLPVRVTTDRALPPVDALVAMGSDPTIAALAARHPRARLSLHGHRFSLAVVQGSDRELARGLARDALLYDGRGCFTPAAVLSLGSPDHARALASALRDELDTHSRLLPPGARDPLLGPLWRQRIGLARALGGSPGPHPPSAAVLSSAHFEAAVLPGFLPVHPVPELSAVAQLLAPWRGWLAGCATDLGDGEALAGLGFERICRPGALQAPPIPRCHGGQEMLRPLMAQRSLELPQGDQDRR